MSSAEKMMTKIVHVRTMDRAKYQIEGVTDVLSELVRDCNNKVIKKTLRECIANLERASIILNNKEIHSASVNGKRYYFTFNRQDMLLLHSEDDR